MTVPPTVVLVDDSEDLRMVVRRHFDKSEDFSVLAEGGSGHEAIALARELHPDVMVMDVSMPGMDGLEALPQVLQASPQTQVVMFTGFAQQGLQERARELGAVALLEKSFSLRALPAEVAKLISRPSVPDTPDTVVAAEHADPAVSLTEEHQERFREVFEEAAIGMGTMTLAGHLVRANKNLASLSGRPAEELVGIAYLDLLDADAREGFANLMEQATAPAEAESLVRDGSVYQLEHHLAGVDQSRRVRTTLAPIRDSRGSALYLFVQLQDVTDLRSAEAALQQAEQHLRSVVESVDDAITMLDVDGVIRSWNRGAERMQGYSSEEIVGQHFRVLYPAEQQRLNHPEHILRLALRDRQYEEEGWRVRADGSRFWANVVLTAIYDAEDTHLGFAKIARDVSERRRRWVEQEAAGDALGRANDQLRAENAGLSENAEAQAQFVAVTAHELRTPVAVIADLAQTLQEEDSDPDHAPMLRTMVSSSARLQRLLDDLLTAARLDAHAMTLDRRQISLGGVLTESVDGMSRRYPDQTISLGVLDSDDRVDADPERLGQIVDNLVNNAINHGNPPVRVSVASRADSVELRVVDSGSGVPLDVRDRLFDRYVTAARSGTGLGLYIVRELARAHGGNAWYEADATEPTFVVSLPRHQPAGEPARPA